MKICYFGVYNPEESRNRIYMRGFRSLGVKLIECQDRSKALLKYIKLFWKHWKIRNDYNVLIVGYPGHILVWFAKLISKKPVIFDALCTMEEGVITSRRQHRMRSLKFYYIKIIDWLAVRCADMVLVESEAQRRLFEKRFGRNDKYKVIYTGADDIVYYIDPKIKKEENFTVIFRGKFLPEAGVKYVVRSAKILEKENIFFSLVGSGFLESEVREEISRLHLKNIEIISAWLSNDEIRNRMLRSHISLGQFENHDRLKRTIPHKAYETLALGLLYVTARAEGIMEILTDGQNCLMVNHADPEDLADKILYAKYHYNRCDEMARRGFELYEEKFSPLPLAKNIISLIQTL